MLSSRMLSCSLQRTQLWNSTFSIRVLSRGIITTPSIEATIKDIHQRMGKVHFKAQGNEEQAKAELEKHLYKLWQIPWVMGAGVGLKTTGGKVTNHLGIIVQVAKKHNLPSTDPYFIPKQYGTIMTDVIEGGWGGLTSRFLPVSDTIRFRHRFDTLTTGTQISGVKGSIGSIGCFVDIKKSSKVDSGHYMITSGHVVPEGQWGQPTSHDICGSSAYSIANSQLDLSVCNLGKPRVRPVVNSVGGSIYHIKTLGTDPPVGGCVIKAGSGTSITAGQIIMKDWLYPYQYHWNQAVPKLFIMPSAHCPEMVSNGFNDLVFSGRGDAGAAVLYLGTTAAVGIISKVLIPIPVPGVSVIPITVAETMKSIKHHLQAEWSIIE